MKKKEKPVPITRPPDKVLPPTTTGAEDDVARGQRRVNIIWEITQAIIALCITGGVIYCQIKNINSPEINYAFFLIVSMYYVRTNHNLIGGVGPKLKGQTR